MNEKTENVECAETVTLRGAAMETIVPLLAETVESGGSMRIYPRGISMLPMLRQGIDSVVLSGKGERLKKYDIPLYKRADGSYVLHRVVKIAENGYICAGDNQIAVERGVKHDDVIAVVTAFSRGGKAHDVSEFRYRFYCVAWNLTRPARRIWRKIKRAVGKLPRREKRT